MTCGKGGLHCSCGIHASDERISQTEEKIEVTMFGKYKFTVEAWKFHCSSCGYTSVSAGIENPYDPVVIKE